MTKNIDLGHLQKKYKRLKYFTAVLVVLFGITLYCTYDYAVFKVLIAGNYIYTDTMDEIYDRVLGKDNVKGYIRDFDRVVIAIVTERLREIGGDDYTYLYTPYGYKASKTQERVDAEKAEVREISSEEVLLKIPNMSAGSSKFVMGQKKYLKNYKNITIDLRGNYGGMLMDNYKIASLFLDKGDILGYEKMRMPFLSHAVKVKNEKYFDFEKITILQNENTASAAESFIMALKENLNNVTLVGTTTFGKGIGQVTIPLTGGYAVKATVLKVETPSEGSIHKKGIAPDEKPDLPSTIAAIH